MSESNQTTINDHEKQPENQENENEVVESLSVEEPEAIENQQAKENPEEEAIEGSRESEKDLTDKKVSKSEKRIRELAKERNLAKEKLFQLQKQNEELLRKLAERKEDGTNSPADEYIQLEARKLAQRELQERTKIENATKYLEKGAKEFGEQAFKDADIKLGEVLPQYGQALELIFDSLDEPHKVMFHLSKDLDEAERILSLPHVKCVRELVRLENQLMTKNAEISKAPKPIVPIKSKSNPDSNIEDRLYTENNTLRFIELRKKHLNDPVNKKKYRNIR